MQVERKIFNQILFFVWDGNVQIVTFLLVSKAKWAWPTLHRRLMVRNCHWYSTLFQWNFNSNSICEGMKNLQFVENLYTPFSTTGYARSTQLYWFQFFLCSRYSTRHQFSKRYLLNFALGIDFFPIPTQLCATAPHQSFTIWAVSHLGLTVLVNLKNVHAINVVCSRQIIRACIHEMSAASGRFVKR